MRSAVSAVLFASAVFAFDGCADGNPTESDPVEVGSYSMLTVNGSPVPVTTVQNSTITTEILSGTFIIYGNHTFGETRVGRVTLAGGNPSATNSSQTGTWEKAGGQIGFTVLNTSGTIVSSFSGTYSSNVLTYTDQGLTFVYRKNEGS